MFFIAIQTKARDAKTTHRGLSNDQKIAHVLTRLTFGIRPGDFEHVKAIGLNEFITQQLNPESMEDTALDERLGKLPTLTIGTPARTEQIESTRQARKALDSHYQIVSKLEHALLCKFAWRWRCPSPGPI